MQKTSSKESQFNWSYGDAKKLLDLAVPLVTMPGQKTSNASWDILARELNVGASGLQCRTKYFNVNRNRTTKKRNNSTCGCGSAPAPLGELESYLDELLSKLKDQVEIPEQEIVNCSSDIFNDGLETNQDEEREQPSVTAPYRKKAKRSHGTGSDQAVVRNTLRQQWLAYLKGADERMKERSANEAEKIKVKEEALSLKRERISLKKLKLKFEKEKEERRNKRQEKGDERMLEIKERLVKTWEDIRDSRI